MQAGELALPVPIKDLAHWKVVLRPHKFNRELISTLDDCYRLVESCRVVVGGRTYPYVDPNRVSTERGNDWVSTWLDSWGQKEYWRFFQSAQFVHLFSLSEDIEHDRWTTWALSRARQHNALPPNFTPSGAADFLEMMCTITEIIEFAARIAQKGPYGDTVYVGIKLVNVKNRLLTSTEPLRSWIRFAPATEDVLGKDWIFPVGRLIADTREIALETVLWFYERFQWKPDHEMIRQEQRKFLEKMLK